MAQELFSRVKTMDEIPQVREGCQCQSAHPFALVPLVKFAVDMSEPVSVQDFFRRCRVQALVSPSWMHVSASVHGALGWKFTYFFRT